MIVIPLHDGNIPFHLPLLQVNVSDDSGIRISSLGQTNFTSLPWENTFPTTFAFVSFDGSEQFSAKKYNQMILSAQ